MSRLLLALVRGYFPGTLLDYLSPVCHESGSFLPHRHIAVLQQVATVDQLAHLCLPQYPWIDLHFL